MKLKIVFFFFFVSLFQFTGSAQKSYGDLYHPDANAAVEIEGLLNQAKAGGKHVILQVGGNWCVWCYRFHDFVEKDPEIKAVVAENFIVYHLNYSKENKNETLLAEYQFPQRFGFPVLVVLDAEGKLLHTQDSGYLESGDGYDAEKVKRFFQSWSPMALNPATYEEKKD